MAKTIYIYKEDGFFFTVYSLYLAVNILNNVGFTGKSHLELDGKLLPRNSMEESVEISFSTQDENGLLLWKSQRESLGLGTSDDYLIISLRKGRPRVEYELGGGQLALGMVSFNYLIQSSVLFQECNFCSLD